MSHKEWVKFHQQFFPEGEKEQFQWFDRKGLCILPNKLRVTIEIVTRGIMDRFEGYLVHIVSPTASQLDSKFFAFNDYLETRIDDRRDDPQVKNQKFEIIKHCGICWYIAEPEPQEIAQMAKAIWEYIGQWLG
jgi:hypothetical protein